MLEKWTDTQGTQGEQIFICKTCFYELSIAGQVSNKNRINGVVFLLTDFRTPAPAIGLDWINVMDKEAFLKEEGINREPI